MPNPHEPATILIPAYNEEGAIDDVFRRVHQVMADSDIEHEVLIVDDGSADGTTAAAHHSGARVIRHLKNRGYGASLKTGIKAAKYEQIIITDADGTYPVERIPDLLHELTHADMVIGARTGQNVNIPLIRRGPKWVLRKLASHVTGEKIPDLNSGLRAFRRSCVLQYLPILSERFSFTTTCTVAMLSDQLLVKFIPIDYHPRVGKSKIVPWDFINFITIVVRLSMLFNPLRVFVPLAATLFLLSVGKFILDLIFAVQREGAINFDLLRHPVVSTTTLILVISSLQVLLIGMISDGLIRKIAQRMPSDYQSCGVLTEETGTPPPAAAPQREEQVSV
ncbi:MAG: glycosyltransferase [Planctomycetes bacterium]|jgi:glycosyltransferase involved in cell wall biosynthesis|nr:glycosyltransferase [Planctomycetota bacterium]